MKEKDRSSRILAQLKAKFPGKKSFDLDGRGLHFVCEIEPTANHPEYDRAVEVILSSKPHKHLKTTQYYTVLTGVLELHIGDGVELLDPGDKHTISPETIHWAESKDECWIEIISRPGWTKEDHMPVHGNS